MWPGARLCKVKACYLYVCDRQELDCVKLKQGERETAPLFSLPPTWIGLPETFLFNLITTSLLYFFWNCICISFALYLYFIFNCVCICITPGSAFFFNLITSSLSAPALFHHLWEIHQTALDKYTWSYLRNTKVQLPPFHSIWIPTSIFIISTFENMVKSQESTRYI